MSIGISNHYVKVAIKGALAQGISQADLLGRAGIDAKQLQNPKGRVTPQQLNTLYKALWSTLRDEFFGLAGSPCKLGYFRLMSSHHPRLETLKAVLDYSAIFFNTTRDDVLFKIETRDGQAKLTMTIDCHQTDTDCFVREYHLIGWQRYISWLIGYRIQPGLTAFNFPETAHKALYRNFFDGEYVFDQPTCHILFDAKYLEYPIIRSHGELQSYLKSLPMPAFYRPGVKQKITALVLGAIASCPLDELPSLEQVADQLRLQKRTLHRRLLKENTSYRQIINEYRLNLAVDLLTKDALPVADVSLQLGFSEPAAFCHFFKRQAGLSPTQYTQFNEAMVLNP